jgi:hypothetical protein
LCCNKLIVSWIDVKFIHCIYRLLWTSIRTKVVRLDLTNDHRWSSVIFISFSHT